VGKRTIAWGSVVTAVAMSAALAACGGSDDKAAAKGDPTTNSAQSVLPGASTNDGGGGSSDVCGLLTDDEVTAVIGAHDPGSTGTQNGSNYGDGSCVWNSTGPPSPASGTPDQVEASVLTGDIATFAREQDAALGEPFPSFGHNAQWQESYGRLWFDCGDNEYCHVRVGTAASTTNSGESRQDAAVELGQQLLSRV
jgi:hypothetical protein